MPAPEKAPSRSRAMMSLERLAEGRAVLRLFGTWRQGQAPSAEAVRSYVLGELGRGRWLEIDLSGVDAWDTCLPMVLVALVHAGKESGFTLEQDGLPAGVTKLMALSLEAPEQHASKSGEGVRWLSRVGLQVVVAWQVFLDALTFGGEMVLSLGRFLAGKSNFRWRDFWLLLDECGARALPIVALISVLTGLILAFIGAVQLRLFGAELYVADLVGLAMSREMAALMTGIIIAGRSGAAFAAHLGSMKVSEEIDALTTFGFHPMDMLVLPRVFALVLMMPLLCLFSNIIGFLGGAVISAGMLGFGYYHYFLEMRTIVTVTDISLGVFKSAVFGFLIAGSGCLQGMHCGANAAEVGKATTKAVVWGIVLIVVADAIFAVACEILNI